MQVSKRIGWVYNRFLDMVKSGLVLPAAALASDQTAADSVVRASKPTAKAKVKSGVERAAIAVAAKPVGAIQTGEIYEALRTEPLRSNAIQFSELTDWVSKGEVVALLEQRKGWMWVKPQNVEKKAGWIQTAFLKRTEMSGTEVPHNNSAVRQPLLVHESVAPAAVEPKQSLPDTVPQAQIIGVYQVVETTKVRTGPGSSFDVLGWVAHGTRVEAIEQQGSWWKVRLQSSERTGWVKAALLKPVNVATEAVVIPVKPYAQAQVVPYMQTHQPDAVKQDLAVGGETKW